MDDDTTDQVCALFARVTARFEDGAGSAIDGQDKGRATAEQRALAISLRGIAVEIVTMIDRIATLTRPSASNED